MQSDSFEPHGRLQKNALTGLVFLFCLIVFTAPAAAADRAVQAIQLALKKQYESATGMARRSGDRAAIKTIEWFYLRRNPRDAGYDRLMAFVKANPNWPS
ncbi:MAG: hypothetical protein ACR2OM_09925, partial [Aestuariivirgaceae bacterium]